MFQLFPDGILMSQVKSTDKIISDELLKILCCPESKADLLLDGDYLVSLDKETRRRYKIVDGIPIMLIEDSEQLELSAWEEVMKRFGKF